MTAHLDRRRFVLGVPAAGAVLLGLAPCAESLVAQPPLATPDALWPEFPRQRPDLAREVVGASHGREARVREIVDAHPALANAWWDWGFGDWESPLGAASHTGQRAIAEYLIAHGARVDIFAATMLGWVDVVRAIVTASPGVQRTLGPHAITLMQHAKAGGEAAATVAEYLQSLGDADTGPATTTLTADEKAHYVGTYRFGPGERDAFVIRIAKENLEFAKDDQPPRRLHALGKHEFFPAGVPSVRLRFEITTGPAQSVTVIDHEPIVTAKRAG